MVTLAALLAQAPAPTTGELAIAWDLAKWIISTGVMGFVAKWVFTTLSVVRDLTYLLRGVDGKGGLVAGFEELTRRVDAHEGWIHDVDAVADVDRDRPEGEERRRYVRRLRDRP